MDGDGWFKQQVQTAAKHVQRSSWPELVGKPATPAVTKIMQDRPDVAVEVLPPGSHVLPGHNPKRVRVFINNLGAVAKTPFVG